MRFRPLRLLGAAAILAATLVPAASALAADAQAGVPGGAITLDKQISGHLGPAGTFAYYKFFYPADGTVATIKLDVTPDDSFVLQNVGFHVYAPNGALVVSGGAQPSLSPDVLANVIVDAPSMKGDYVVQVFDYDVSRSVDFTIWAEGLGQQPLTAPPASAAAAAPVPAQPAPTQSQAVGTSELQGSLAPGGSFAQYEFAYPGDQSVFTVNLKVTPNDPAVLDLAGFEIYAPDGALVVRGGAQPGLTSNVSANVISKQAGRYMVQIYNYHPSAAVDFQVVLVTSPPPIAAV